MRREAQSEPQLEQVFSIYGLPQAFFVDNGNPWSDGHGGQYTKFRVWLLKYCIQLIHAKPHLPQSRGKNERFHHSMEDEVFAMRQLASQSQAEHIFTKWRGIALKGRDRTVSKANTSPSGHMINWEFTESTLAQTTSRRLTWQHEKVSTMFPNTCQLCNQSKQKAWVILC
jgi:transposase InsO family protein